MGFGMLPRRLLRYLLYVLTALVLSSFVLLFAHKHEFIVLDNYLPTHLTPSFFQPPSDLYLVDISINNCLKWNRKSATCGLPGGSTGLYGNLHTVGGWIKVSKDLTLGRKLMSREFLSYKQVQRKFFTRGIKGKDDYYDDDSDDAGNGDRNEENRKNDPQNQLIIIDIAVADPVNDAAIKGNENTKYPKAVLDDFQSSRIFTDQDYEEMTGEGASGDALTKSTSNQKAGEEINKIENDASRKEDEDKKKQSELDSETPEEQLSDTLKQEESKNEKEEENKKNKQKGSELNQMEIVADAKANMEKQKQNSESDPEKLNEALSEEEQKAAAKKKEKKKPLKEEQDADKEEQKKSKEEMDKLMQENKKEKSLLKENGKETAENDIDVGKLEYDNMDNPTEREHGPIIKKRKTENDRHALNGYHHIPTKEEIAQRGWVQKTKGIWVRYGSFKTKYPVTAIDLLFGSDAVEPRPNWKLIPIPLQGGYSKKTPVYITFRKGPKMDYKKKYQKSLNFNSQGKFKILQVADLHFSTGYGKCRDPHHRPLRRDVKQILELSDS